MVLALSRQSEMMVIAVRYDRMWVEIWSLSKQPRFNQTCTISVKKGLGAPFSQWLSLI